VQESGAVIEGPPKDDHSAQARASTRRYLTIAVVGFSLWVTQSFLVPLAWASVLAITIWPIYKRAAGAPRHRWLPPLVATLGTAVVLMLPLSALGVEAATDSKYALA